MPKKYFEPFPLDSIQLPPGYKADDLDDVPAVGVAAARNRYFAHICEQGQWKQGIQGYLASVHFADAMLGRVLDALEASPYADNTIVVLWSDHGWQLGEKEHWQKYTPWRAVTRVPLMIRVPEGVSSTLPKGTPAGAVCDAPVNLLSLYATLVELCGLPEKSGIDGPSLLPLLDDPRGTDWPHQSVTYLSKPGSYSVNGRTHQYIHYHDGSEELYDFVNDRYEWTNLAADPESSELLAKFRRLSPTDFHERVEPSVDSLAKLKWRPSDGVAPPLSKPDGNAFPIYFTNRRGVAIEVCLVDSTGTLVPKISVEAGARGKQKSRPGEVWLIRSKATGDELGYFVVDDRTAEAIIAIASGT